MTCSTSCLCDTLTDVWNVRMYLLFTHCKPLFICLWGAAVSHLNYSVGRGMEHQLGKCLGVQHWSEDTNVIRFSLLN